MKKGDVKRTQILDTAEKLFFERGYDRTSVQDILDELHLSKGGFYHYFDAKDSVLRAVSERRAQDRFDRLTGEAKGAFADFLSRELERYLAMECPDRDVLENLELMADLCAHLPADATGAQLTRLLELGHSNIAYFAAASLLALKLELPQTAVETLARDLGYANMAHALLKKHGMAARFPAECATEEYLAKSDLVHWLLYPTELGKAPDEIEYIGKSKRLLKKEVYHIFRFRSDSDTLNDDCRGKWLIGWSNAEGGTFSNFDLYDDYAKATPEATVKHIRKKLIG